MMCMNSLDVQSLDSSDNTTTNEVVTFVDNSSGDVNNLLYNKSVIASAGITSRTDLQTYLSRPTLIDSRVWTTSATGITGTTIEPWYLFMNNPLIKNKLANYAFLRAKLCLKFIINGSPFHYGCLRVSYQPSMAINSLVPTSFRGDRIQDNSVSQLPFITPYSQLPGVWILPADNSAGELHVPFFLHSNFVQLWSANDIKSLGRLVYYIAFPLSVASATATNVVDVDTFAWLEDVELSATTNQMVLQSIDEYDTPIATAASSVAKISSYLDKVPVIGKFARATTIGASAIASIAGMFGFTNTPVIDSVHAVIPTTSIHLASSEISTPIQKLTLDPKQELSIDPTLHGISNADEMSIKHIVTKHNTLVMAGWSTTDLVGEVIFNSRIHPLLNNRVPISSGGVVKSNRIYSTYTEYLGRMFTHWRGDMMFEFQVICTKFHKGRLKISWDPLGGGGTVAPPENSVYTTILDIGENNKAIMRIPYHQSKAFLRTRRNLEDNWTAGNPLNIDTERDNGLLTVSVFTGLISPISPANVGLMVSVYGADNFEFANPASSIGVEEPVHMQPSFFTVQSSDKIDIVASEVTLGDTGSKHPNRYDLNFGERIVSLRALLHRRSLYDTSILGDKGDTRLCTYVKSYTRLPPSYGYDPNGKSTAIGLVSGTSKPFTWSPMHPSTYLANMYGAMRGSMNYSCNVSNDIYPSIGDIRVQRVTTSNMSTDRLGVYKSGLNAATSVNAIIKYLNNEIPYNFTAGGCINNTMTNGSINWNAPMMNNNNFEYTDPRHSISGNIHDGTTTECTYMSVFVKQQVANTTSASSSFVTYAGTGPDYTLLWLLCCPTVDYYASIPTP